MPIDHLVATRHDLYVDEDYRLVAAAGMRAVREGIRWTSARQRRSAGVDPHLRRSLDSGRRHEIEIVFDLCHFGYPSELDVHSTDFVERFAEHCGAVARVVAAAGLERTFFTPLNEPSYWAWAGGDEGRINPCAFGRGAELKRQLVRAAIAAMEAIRDVEPRARFITAEVGEHVRLMNVEPLKKGKAA